MIENIIKKYKEFLKKQEIKGIETVKKHPTRWKTIMILFPIFMFLAWIPIPIVSGKAIDELFIFFFAITVLASINFSYEMHKIYKKAMKNNNKIIISRKNIFIVIFTVFILFITLNATASTVIDLGTIDYQDYKQINIPGTSEVNLVFITSIMNQSDITVQNLGFVPSLNYTRYLLTSNTITPTFHMKNMSLSYYYQDILSLQLYKINIDYKKMQIPDNPDLVNFTKLNKKYKKLLANNTNQTYIIENLTKDYNIINESYNEIHESLNTTRNELNNSKNELKIRNSNLINMTKQRNDNRTKYNETKNAMIIQLGNLTNYENFYNEIKSAIGVYIPYDYTIPDTRLKIKDEIFDLREKKDAYESLSFMTPITVIIAIISTFLITILITYMKWRANRSLSDEEENSKYGYTGLSSRFDRFFQSLGRIKKAIPTHKPANNNTNNYIQENKKQINQENNNPVKINDNNKPVKSDYTNDFIDQKLHDVNIHNNIDQELARRGYQ